MLYEDMMLYVVGTAVRVVRVFSTEKVEIGVYLVRRVGFTVSHQ
jgi:hypothetical protein